MGGVFGYTKKDRTKTKNGLIKTPTKGKGEKNAEYTFKVLTVGDCGVGKSSLMLQYVESSFDPDKVDQPLGFDSLTKKTTVDNKPCSMEIWDTAGQERFAQITSSYYRGAQIILIVFDLTNTQSFENVPQWLQEVDRYAHQTAIKLVVGTKVDLESERMVNTEDVEQFCQQKGLTYIETSAKTGHGVDSVFTTACHQMLDAIADGTVSYEFNDD